jgi:hypothetical protein
MWRQKNYKRVNAGKIARKNIKRSKETKREREIREIMYRIRKQNEIKN